MWSSPGDEGFVKMVHSSVFGRTDERSPKERLSPLVPVAQEFHSAKVTLLGSVGGKQCWVTLVINTVG